VTGAASVSPDTIIGVVLPPRIGRFVQVRLNRSAGILVGFALCSLSPWASADWPMARRDAQRTAQATGSSDIDRPVAYWRRYLGGYLDPAALVLADVNSDDASEILMIAGGSAVAKTRGDAVVWRSQNFELSQFIGVADLDGEPGEEIVARSEKRAYVLDQTDGSVLWATPAGELGFIGAARLGDIDGDNLDDLIVVDCVCCQVRGENAGYAYSFASGVASPTRLWQFPSASCGGGNSLTLVRGSDNQTEVLYGEDNALVLLDGADGSELARSPNLGSWVQRSRCVPIDVVGSRTEELICAHDVDYDPTINERKVFALRYANGSLTLLWSVALAPVEGGQLSFLDLVSDLDGDGSREVVVSALVEGNWTTHVLDATTGTSLDTIPGELVMGVASGETSSVLLTSSATHLSGWNLVGDDLELGWTVLDAVVLTTHDLARGARSSVARTAAVARVDGDRLPDVIAILRSAPGTLVGYSVAGGDVSELARYDLPTNVHTQNIWPLASAADVDLQLAVAHDDGFLTLFEEGLAPARSSHDDVSFAQIRTGGYYARGWPRFGDTPRAGPLDDGPDRIIVTDSRGSLLRLDAEIGSFASPPPIRWELLGGSGASIVEGLDGDRPGLACLAVDLPKATPPTWSIVAVDGDGRTLWRQPAPPAPLNDVVPGTFGRDRTDLVFQWGDPGDLLLHTRAVSGADGSTLWDTEPVNAGSGRKPAGMALGRFDGDDVDDVYHQVQMTQVLSGADGSVLSSTPEGPDYFMPTLVNVDEDDSREVVLHGGPQNVRVLDHDLGSLFVSGDANRPFPYGAVANCGEGRQVLVGGSAQYSARLKLTELSGAASGAERTLVLAGGELFADEVAAAASGILGQLTSATVHQNLTGRNRPSAVVGSSDGWLYAIDPCTPELDFTYAFEAPVGEAIFADTDGDGRDEILVTVEDGFLYSLRDFEIDAPSAVHDTDPWSEAGDDIAEVHTIDTLEASWAEVAGASHYEVAVVDRDGNYVGGEPWRNAGRGTSFLIVGLPLEDKMVYRVSVRAVSSEDRRSVDTVSNGVWVHLLPENDPPGGGCCSAANGVPSLTSGLFLLSFVSLVRSVRRQRSR
jgi:hypothetical protein